MPKTFFFIKKLFQSKTGKKSFVWFSKFLNSSDRLFGRVPSEDIAGYDQSVLDHAIALAANALSEHRKGQCFIHSDSGSNLLCHGRPVTIFTIVNDNMPFLFDSVLSEITEVAGYPFLAAHPVLPVHYNDEGIIEEILEEDAHFPKEQDRVSLIQIHIKKLSNEKTETLQKSLFELLGRIRLVVSDWKPMLNRLNQTIWEFRNKPIPFRQESIHEAIAFLEWIREDNFIFLGMRDVIYSSPNSRSVSGDTEKSGLGILSDPEAVVLWQDIDSTHHRVKEMQAFFRGSDPLVVGVTNVKSTIHRRVYMVYVALKVFDDAGILTGQRHIIGLFTSSVSNSSVMKIPYLRSKATSVISGSGLDLRDHSGKALINVLETYPRDELFQISIPMLRKHCEAILNLIDRPRVRALIRLDPMDRFVSVLIFVPRDRYGSLVREQIGAYLQRIFDGRLSAFHPFFPEGSLARVHFIIARSGGKAPKVKSAEVEAAIYEIIKTWEDVLYEAAASIEKGEELVDVVLKFPDNYRNSFSPSSALIDAQRIEPLGSSDSIDLFFYRDMGQTEYEATLKIYHFNTPVSLSRRVPILENMGFRVISEHTFEIMNKNLDPIFIHEMALESNFHKPILLSDQNCLFKRTFLWVWKGKSDNDGYNALTHTAGLAPEDLGILRACGRYFQQIGIPQSQRFIAGVLNRYPDVSRKLHALFITRFDPEIKNRGEGEKNIKASLSDALNSISNIDDDMIIRRYINLIESFLRTNYFSPVFKEGACSLAIKLDPRVIHIFPEPRPWREIFVYGSEVEGVHLRFGSVSRGGLRWSDRAQDYRTEVLGLVKAQQVKNAVIVPVGAKGGFYPKRLSDNTSSEDVKRIGSSAYINFVSSLLSVTDNLQDGKVIPPKKIVCHDDNDPYLVVAADKGTATFSDTANAISMKQGFWLDDAFASGGSAGYDHKKMGITAKGAWEAVKRHFREMNHDIQTQSFSMCGVGDMSGDVFGNALLLSEKIRLVAAFDHRDVFIDPEADESVSFLERQRLFGLPSSSWKDYDRSRLSKGGMIFSRLHKSVSLTPEAMDFLGFVEKETNPLDVIKAILQAKVDLLWFGGIGTYVKSSRESNEDVGDHANDFIRVNASQLRSKIIGEGANLALTQSARIQFCLNGGACNSDALDNSGGVNSSDIEVNIKIALADAMRRNLLSRKVRDQLLFAMTDQVSELVLANNYSQTLAVSLAHRRGLMDLTHQEHLILSLEQKGLLNRSLETLPTSLEMQERKTRNEPLTRPEICVLLAYAKISLFSDVLASDLPDDFYFEKTLMGYFPFQMQKKYSDSIRRHPLKREIISRVLANEIINHGGPEFVVGLSEVTANSPHDVIRAFFIIFDGFDLRELFRGIDALDNHIDGKAQLDCYLAVQKFLRMTTAWELKNRASFSLDMQISNLRKVRKTLEPRLKNFLSAHALKELEERCAGFLGLGVPSPLAQKMALLDVSHFVADIALIAGLARVSIPKAARVFFSVTNRFRIDQIENLADSLVLSDCYEEMALLRSLDVMNSTRRSIVVDILSKFIHTQDPLKHWIESGGEAFSRHLQRFKVLSEGSDMSLSRFMLISGVMHDFLSFQMQKDEKR